MSNLEILIMILIGWKPLVKTLKMISRAITQFLRKHDSYISNWIVPIVASTQGMLGIVAKVLVLMIISLQTVSDVLNGSDINTVIGMLTFKILAFFIMSFAMNKILIKSDKKLTLQLRLLIS